VTDHLEVPIDLLHINVYAVIRLLMAKHVLYSDCRFAVNANGLGGLKPSEEWSAAKTA
jgi:hypothetical protein